MVRAKSEIVFFKREKETVINFIKYNANYKENRKETHRKAHRRE